MKTIKIKFIGKWPNIRPEDNLICYWLMKNGYDVQVCEDADYLICDVFGEQLYDYCKYSQIRILETGENYTPDFNLVDYAICRYPITFAETVKVPSAPRIYKGYNEDRCLLKSIVKTPTGDLCVMCCHFGLMPNEAELCAKTVVDAIPADLPTVFMGDLNLTPDSDLLDPVRSVLVDTDTYYKGECNFTFPSDKPDIKIDYIFVSRDIKVEEVEIPNVIAADHLPVVADISY